MHCSNCLSRKNSFLKRKSSLPSCKNCGYSSHSFHSLNSALSWVMFFSRWSFSSGSKDFYKDTHFYPITILQLSNFAVETPVNLVDCLPALPDGLTALPLVLLPRFPSCVSLINLLHAPSFLAPAFITSVDFSACHYSVVNGRYLFQGCAGVSYYRWRWAKMCSEVKTHSSLVNAV